QGFNLKQDPVIAEFYSEKITYGEANVTSDLRNAEFAQALPKISEPPHAQGVLDLAATKSAKSETVPVRSSLIRVALVIGDSNYSNLPKLGNPANDARAIAELLQKIGFTVKLVTEASESDLRREVRKFASDSAKADIALVFYAGHGAQVSG